MCELTVFLGKEVVAREVVYAKVEGNSTLLKNVLGVAKTIQNCRIAEVDISSERLVLTSR